MIPVFRPQLDPDAVWRELRPVIESGWLGQGEKVAQLEAALAPLCGAKHFIALSSGTAALHLAVKALCLPKGARVLTTPITFVSTNAALLWEGLTPVFGEVDADGQLCATSGDYGTVATIAVHLGGAVSPVRCRRYIPVIEDCAHAFGAPWSDDPQRSLMRTWSFHAVKNLPMGDGGGISTNDDELAEWLRRMRWMGIDKSTHARITPVPCPQHAFCIASCRDCGSPGYTNDYAIPQLGYKYHMNDVTAAIGLATLPLVRDQIAARQRIANVYRQALPGNAPSYAPELSACHFYPMFFDNRVEVEERLKAAGIAYSRHYQPNFLFPDFRGYPTPGFESAMRYWDRVLVLPMFPGMTSEECGRVIEAVKG